MKPEIVDSASFFKLFLRYDYDKNDTNTATRFVVFDKHKVIYDFLQ